MTIYIDREFDSTTLAGLLEEVKAAATEEWFQNLESEVWCTYRDLARADVKAGYSTPADHRDLSPGWFVESPFSLNDPHIMDLYRDIMNREEVLNRRSMLFDPKFGIARQKGD